MANFGLEHVDGLEYSIFGQVLQSASLLGQHALTRCQWPKVYHIDVQPDVPPAVAFCHKIKGHHP